MSIISEIMQQAQRLSPQERKELVKLLVDTLDTGEHPPLKTGAQLADMLAQMDPIEFVDPEIEDPVEWVKAQRRKESDRLKPYWDDEQ